jgi:predicted metal-binding protein
MGKSQEKYRKSDNGKEVKKIWRLNNRDKIRKWKLKWAKSENGKEQARKWRKKSHKSMYILYKKGAARRGIVFDISYDDFVKNITRNCQYCNASPPEDCKRNGLDRVNNSEGYELNNIVPCCFKCNQMKGKLSVEEFIDHIRRILKWAD